MEPREGVGLKQALFVLLVVTFLAVALYSPKGNIEEGTPSQLINENDEVIQGSVINPDMAHQFSGIEGFFTENLGQLGEGAGLYYAHGDPLSVAFGRGWVAYDQRDGSSGVLYRMEFLEANPVEPLGVQPLPHRSHFLSGGDPNGWITEVRNYGEVVYKGLWDDIDVRFYFHEGLLKYDVVIRPGGNPSQVGFRYEGIDGLSIDPSTGDVEIQTSLGEIREQAPFAFQSSAASKREVDCGFHLKQESTLVFEVGDFDPSGPLVIDPGLAFSTFIGGSGE